MANWYVYSGAAGAGTGADWTNAYTTLEAAMTAKAAGDTFFVAHNHAQTTASALTLASNGTEASPCKVLCVNSAGSVPPVSADLRTTATITTTGGVNMSLTGTVSECNGIIFNGGTAGAAANINIGVGGRTWRFINCSFRLSSTNTNSRITCTSTMWENCTVQFGNVSQAIAGAPQSRMYWRNTPSAIVGATIPTALFNSLSQAQPVLLEGIDLSAMTSAKNLMAHGTNAGTLILKNCKLSTTANTAPSGTAAFNGTELQILDSDSGDVHYRNERYNFMGTQSIETTIVLSGGASDGTTPIAWKIVTTADAEREMPFEALPIYIWNDTTGSSKTVTLQGRWGGGAVPLNDDIWIDVYAKTNSGFPLVTKYTSGKADTLATGANCSSGTGSWGGSTTSFSMAVTFTPAEKGLITIYIRAGAASSTFYIDPLPVIT